MSKVAWNQFRAWAPHCEEGFFCEHWESGTVRFGFEPIEIRESNELTTDQLIRDLEWVEASSKVDGVFGLMTYEAGTLLDRVRGAKTLPNDAWRFGRYKGWIEAVEDRMVAMGLGADHYLKEAPAIPEGERFQTTEIQTSVAAEQYESWVVTVREYIRAGDVFQVNLAHPVAFSYKGDPLELYEAMRGYNPSPYAGVWFHRPTKRMILSNSPELLVRDVQGDLTTKPIAGTRRRAHGQEDDELVKELFLSPKERAEHLMLVDLERNDLGRIGEYGSVRVPSFMHCEQYRNVSHIVSTVVARRRREVGLVDLIRALFPGGTITGAPKLRSMEIIAELESCPRGYYTGAMGWFDEHSWCLNILIRTAQLHDGRGLVHVGAGLVADSVPKAEYEETLHKAAAWKHILESFQ